MGIFAPEQTAPEVSVIVPARNEEVSLGACLESLVSQTGVHFEIIVVDDGSTDKTRHIASSFSGVRVISPGPLPPGWTGKNNALAAGASSARGKWLLFTDADTVHRPGSLARALAEAKANGAVLLSYSPQQEVKGLWEKVVMAVIFSELACTYRPSDVCDPALPAAAANGQYLLVYREAYEAVGGHRSIAGSLLEDVALARAIKRSGKRIFFRYGGDAVCTRMYRNFAQLREGWTKNLALLFPSPGTLALTRLAEFLILVGGVALFFALLMAPRPASAFIVAMVLLAVAGRFARRIAKAHFSWESNLLAIFGLPVFTYLLLRSRLSHNSGTVTWKGRTYRGSNTGVTAGVK